ncbi:Ethanolamine ammonia-lyase light chain [Pilibacter termitis]|uniref:Ethanolamine ammonia-lyase small subunit n=1 Tax=Pilibacter termitis TaxID=263852 RepID=A0A1T4K6C3_9ENTE|nr:ethanolamine ammonia-lyase subunit EutC [Pilibacter termitis]SJZ37962.1 Ethanolamine ammonia-lyase light chain [Pilibacter termitis]
MKATELRTMIESILKEMTQSGNTTQVKETVATLSQSPSVIEDGVLEDITEIDIRKQLLVENPKNREGYLKMKFYTPARLGCGREGTRYKLQTQLRFRADHAAAQDSVFSEVPEELVEKMNFVSVKTVCESKDDYLTSPPRGRQFDKANEEKIRAAVPKKPKVQIVVGDGLSSAAIGANIEEILPSIKQGLKMHGIEVGEIIFVKYCRVPAMDAIGEYTDADVVCLLVGERPGLVTAEAMSAYVAYRPTVGMPEARRTVLASIHKGGTPAVEAGAYIADLIKKMLDAKKSGIDLKQA